MSSLHLTIDFTVPYDDEPWTFEYKTFDVLNEYLQPQSHTSPASAAIQLNDLLEHVSILQIWDIIFRVAAQVPHDHPSQDRLMALIFALRDFPVQPNRFAELDEDGEAGQATTASTRNSSPWRNLQTLAARLTHAGLAALSHDAIITLSLALECRPDPRSRAYQTRATKLDFHVPIAAQWIMVAGRELYAHIAAASGRGDTADYAAGPVWKNRKGGTWIERWTFWKDGFADVAEKEEVCGEDVRKVARLAVERMEEIEREGQGA
ncbi:hypothetical protein UCDDS831_g08311 [Diplodia seriata]|uniref:Uncharacterized protein n=1 Tax=Diplodia seriata TaxID=420778 RepID=A0A0G2GAT4_9PEZI|nr:hypothetical protein UCDDS831_g08311 [Diplodia seriata]